MHCQHYCHRPRAQRRCGQTLRTRFRYSHSSSAGPLQMGHPALHWLDTRNCMDLWVALLVKRMCAFFHVSCWHWARAGLNRVAVACNVGAWPRGEGWVPPSELAVASPPPPPPPNVRRAFIPGGEAGRPRLASLSRRSSAPLRASLSEGTFSYLAVLSPVTRRSADLAVPCSVRSSVLVNLAIQGCLDGRCVLPAPIPLRRLHAPGISHTAGQAHCDGTSSNK